MDIYREKKLILIGVSIVSPLHLINFMSVFMSNRDSYSAAYVGLSGFLKSRNIPHRYLEFCKKKGVEFFDNDQIYSKLLSGGRYDFVFINDFAYKIIIKNIFRLNDIYFIDEGISTYVSRKKLFYNEVSKGGIAVFLKCSIKYCLHFLFKYWLNKKIYHFNFFDKNDYSVNDQLKNFYIDFLKKIPLNSGVLGDFSSTVLYCTQPFLEMGKISSEEFLLLLKKMESFFEERGYEFLIKKHPAEYLFDYENNGFKTINFDGMVEEFVIKFPIAFLVSKNSTSSLLINALNDTPCYVLDYHDIKNYGEDLEILFSKYCLPFELLK